MIEFFKTNQPPLEVRTEVKAIGVACFGLLDPNPASPTFGRILPTPKTGWTNIDIVGTLQGALGVPVAFDTDANAAGLVEARWGAGKDCDPVRYLTVDTRIGGVRWSMVIPSIWL